MTNTSAAASGLIHGPQSPLTETKRACARIAASDATVLLTGETGTGKEVFARFIHASSPRSGKPFVPVNCGAIPETLLESELFGYVKGAFTGAVASRRGRVAMAEGGTLFLDEVGELPLPLQVKLLRLLQEKTFEPIGSSESVPANFRLVAATNRDLSEEVKAGRFRSDLYYRLHVCPVRLPALRERRSDVAHLFAHFWARRGETRAVEAAVIQSLEIYQWPGNVRELENLVERISVCAEGDVIRVADLPIGIRAPHLEPMDGGADRDAINVLRAPAFVDMETTQRVSAVLPRELLRPTEPNGVASLSSIASELRSAARESGQTNGACTAIETPDSEHTPALETVAPANGAGVIPFPPPGITLPIDLPTMLRDLENAYINAALARTGSNKKEAAKLLGMGRTTLVEKLRRRTTDASRS